MEAGSTDLAKGRSASANVNAIALGVGGGGGNVLERLSAVERLRKSLRLVAVDTDARALEALSVEGKLRLGNALTRGLGCGGDVALGKASAESGRDAVREQIGDCDLIFLVATMGGGVGSGAAPIVAEVAAEAGAVVVGFVSLPFGFEGEQRLNAARKATAGMREFCDALITLPNDLLLPEGAEGRTAQEVLTVSDQWIQRGIDAVCAMLFEVGWMQVDLASLKRALGGKGGRTLFAFGEGSDCGAAMGDILDCPLLELDRERTRADSLLVHIANGPDVPMSLVHELVVGLNKEFGCEKETTIGATRRSELGNRVIVSVIGSTDLENRKFLQPRRARPEMLPTDPDAIRPHELEIATAASGQQEEFSELIDGGNRGIFGSTERNLRGGVDLDVPTFIRKGIKIRT